MRIPGRHVLSIAGSDPSGGAGVQADLRVFTALDVAGLSAITALTVQDSHGLRAVYPTPGEVLYDQIDAVLTDCTVDAVKIGMLAGAEQVQAVADALSRHRPPNIVLDPVLASTGGFPLLDSPGRDALLSGLVPLCDLITPNIMELGRLSHVREDQDSTLERSASLLFDRGAKAVLVKGGHLPGRPVDILMRADGTGVSFEADRIDTVHTHGTGCFLSAAIAAYLADGLSLQEAISAAKQLLTRALSAPIIAGRGRGYPDAFAATVGFASAGSTRISEGHAARCKLLEASLYVITDSDLRPNRSAENITVEALAGGAKIIQLREKRLGTPALVALAQRLAGIVKKAGALLIINDRVDVALASDADGVHLGPADMQPMDARRILGPDKLIGVSAGTVDEAAAQVRYASYIGVGAIFGSTTKQDAGSPVGIERIRDIRRALAHVPVPIVAIGGINESNIADCARAGADSAAVISAVICAPDMQTAARKLLATFVQARTTSRT